VRIALFCPSYGQVGGIETKAERLIAGFRGAGHAVTVLARGEPSVADADGVRVTRVRFHQLPRRMRHVARELRFRAAAPGVGAALLAAAESAGADVVLSLAITSYAPYVGRLARRLPVVLSLEGGEPGGVFTARPRPLRRALLHARRVVACAGSLAKAAIALAPEIADRLTVVPNGVDAARFAAATPWSHPRPYILAVGRLVAQKGFDVLLDALSRAADGLGVDCLIAGDGPDRAALEARRNAAGLGARVRFLGTVGLDALPALYRGAVLVACPSRWEGLPLVVLEAMATGRPVVASAVDGIPDAVVDGETGILVPPEEPAALAEAITRLVRDPGASERLGAAGAVRAHDQFGWPRITAAYLDVLAAATAA
jgi:glycosyltransferase involved in cell wall biosynthesis